MGCKNNVRKLLFFNARIPHHTNIPVTCEHLKVKQCSLEKIYLQLKNLENMKLSKSCSWPPPLQIVQTP